MNISSDNATQVRNGDGFTNRVFHGGGNYGLTLDEFDRPFVWLLVRTPVFDSIPGDVELATTVYDNAGAAGGKEEVNAISWIVG